MLDGRGSMDDDNVGIRFLGTEEGGLVSKAKKDRNVGHLKNEPNKYNYIYIYVYIIYNILNT